MPDQIYGVSLNGVEKQSYSFDNLGRLLTKTVNVSAGKNITYSYEYKNVGDNGTTTVVETFVNDLGTYEYEYDGNGNITKETFTASGATAPTKVTVYEYDKLGQLKLVNINRADRYAYRYDASGNIVNIGYIDEKGDYYPTNYTYGNANWRDQLTSFNGEAITYDEIGNPLSYRGATLTWQNGRQLAKYQKGSMIAEYKYDGNGNRISKSHNGNTYEFIYNGSNLVAMTNTGTTLFNWICDENGDYLGFTYCGVEYYYIRNLQNDVIGIKNPSGKVVVEYEYDPFGKVIATKGPLADTLGKLNPIRYRGYFYDTETGFYFLQSRYYDPDTCRFINADGLVSTGQGILGYNMYAYCNNNPVMGYDPYGTFDLLGFAKGVSRIVTGIAAVAAGVAVCVAGAPVAMMAVATVTVIAGVLTAVNGAADIQQSVTGDNFVRDTVFNGNQTAYDVYSGVTETIAVVGTAVCGNYLSNTCTMKGAVPGTEGKVTLEPGTTLERYGDQYGRYLTEPGTSINQLALTPGNSCNPTTYVVNRSFTFSTGIVAHCAWGPGGGVQYFSWMSVQRLVQFGFLTPLG